MADYSKDEIKRIEKKWQEKWVTDGTVFYLQEAGRPLTRDNTLGTVTIIVRDRI